MDLDPETVKQEIEAVQFACQEVDARLRSRANHPRSGGILARVSKVSVHPEDGNGHRDRPAVQHNDSRNSSRRDWNIARKRTAQGLFADDQAEQTGTEPQVAEGQPDTDQNGSHARKRIHREESYNPSQPEYPSDHGKSIGSRITFQGRDNHHGRSGDQNGWRRGGEQQYNPFDALGHADHPEPRQRHYENNIHHERGNARQEREYARGPDMQPLGPYNRGGKFQRHNQRDHMHDRPQFMPYSRDREQLDSQGRTWEQEAREEAGGDQEREPQQREVAEEEGELPEDMPGPPEISDRPMEAFVAEKRPEPKHAITAADRGRNKRMLGALMGHLHRAEKQERTFEQSDVVQRRKELEAHAQMRAREEAFKARAAARAKEYAARRKDVSEKRELLLQRNMKEAKLLCAQKIHHARDLLKFIRTQTVPPILWKPARQNADVTNIYEQQAQDFELWADKQAAKLQSEQQSMRERAEKQWAEIDSVHEERLRGRRSGPLPPPPRGGRDRGGSEGERGRSMSARPDRQEATRGPIQLSTAQLAMLEREKKKSSGGGGQPVQLSTAQQAMLERERGSQAAAEGDAGKRGQQVENHADEQEMEADVEEDERRQAEEDDAEALDEGYLLDDAALEDEAAASDLDQDDREHMPEVDAAEEQGGRFEADERDVVHDYGDDDTEFNGNESADAPQSPAAEEATVMDV